MVPGGLRHRRNKQFRTHCLEGSPPPGVSVSGNTKSAHSWRTGPARTSTSCVSRNCARALRGTEGPTPPQLSSEGGHTGGPARAPSAPPAPGIICVTKCPLPRTYCTCIVSNAVPCVSGSDVPGLVTTRGRLEPHLGSLLSLTHIWVIQALKRHLLSCHGQWGTPPPLLLASKWSAAASSPPGWPGPSSGERASSGRGWRWPRLLAASTGLAFLTPCSSGIQGAP